MLIDTFWTQAIREAIERNDTAWLLFFVSVAVGYFGTRLFYRVRARRRPCQPGNAGLASDLPSVPPAASVVRTCLVCGKDCTNDPVGHAKSHGFMRGSTHVQSDLQRRPFKVVGSYKGGRS